MSLSTRRSFTAAAATALAAPWLAPRPSFAQTPAIPPEAEVTRILMDRVDVNKTAVGMAVGLIGPEGRRVIRYGEARLGGPPIDGRTLFGIGSVGKMFTAVLLTDMVVRGEARLDDPVEAYLPKGMTLSGRARAITLADLATHTSGLPFMPPGVRSFETYDQAAFADFLAGYEPARAPGAAWEYSNSGYVLLGLALSERTGLDYDRLVRRRIAGPLGLKSTFNVIPPGQMSRLAQGYDRTLKPMAGWNPGVLAQIGVIYTTADDLLRLFSLADGRSSTSLGQAFALLPKTRRAAPLVGEQALGWEIKTAGRAGPFLSKDGLGRGFGCSVVFDPAASRGVVVMTNVEGAPSDVARHLLRPAIPLAKHYVFIAMDPALLERFVGVYQLAPGRTAAVTTAGGRLWLQFPNFPKLPLGATADTAFANADVGVGVTFKLDGQARAVSLTVTSPDGVDTLAPRVG